MSTLEYHPIFPKSNIEYDEIAAAIDVNIRDLKVELKDQLVFPLLRSISYSQFNLDGFSTNVRIVIEKLQELEERSRENLNKALQSKQDGMNKEHKSDDFSDSPSASPVGRRQMRVDSNSETIHYDKVSIPPVVTLQADDTSSVTPISNTASGHMPIQNGTTLEGSNKVVIKEEPVVGETEIIHVSDGENRSITFMEEEWNGKSMVARRKNLGGSSAEDQPLATGSNSPREDTEIDDNTRDGNGIKTYVKRKHSTSSSRKDCSTKKRLSGHK
jgi:hypothetical protein